MELSDHDAASLVLTSPVAPILPTGCGQGATSELRRRVHREWSDVGLPEHSCIVKAENGGSELDTAVIRQSYPPWQPQNQASTKH